MRRGGFGGTENGSLMFLLRLSSTDDVEVRPTQFVLAKNICIERLGCAQLSSVVPR